MADIDHNIGEIIEMDKLLNLLDIKVDDEASISDGEITYNLYTIFNLDGKKRDILVNLGFEEFKESIFCTETKEIRTKEVLEYLLPMYQKKEIGYWDEIIEKLVSINEKKIIFTPTSKQLRIVTTWKGKLAKNEDEFRSFVSDLCLIFRDSCKEGRRYRINEKCRSNDFWKTIGDLRNYYFFHDPEQWGEDAVEKFSKKGITAYKSLFMDPTPKKSSLDFINAQLKLLTICIEFLDCVSEGI